MVEELGRKGEQDRKEIIFDHLRMFLNDGFKAGIKKENFLITRPPFFIHCTAQAVFPPRTNLSKRTPKISDKVMWEFIEGK